jgi:hypothetical protein
MQLSKFDVVNSAMSAMSDVAMSALESVPCVFFGCIFDPANVSAPDGWTLTYYPSAPMIPIDPEDPMAGFLPQLPQVGDIWEMRKIMEDPNVLGPAAQVSRFFDLQSWPLSMGTLQVPALPEVLANLDALTECGVALLTDVEYTGNSPYEIEYRAIMAALQTGGGP